MSASAIFSMLPVASPNGVAPSDASGSSEDAQGAFVGLLETLLGGEDDVAAVAPPQTAESAASAPSADTYGLLASGLNLLAAQPEQSAPPPDHTIQPVERAFLDEDAASRITDERTRHETHSADDQVLKDTASAPALIDDDTAPQLDALASASKNQPAQGESTSASAGLRATEIKLAELALKANAAGFAEDTAQDPLAPAPALAADGSALNTAQRQTALQNQNPQAQQAALQQAAPALKPSGEFKSNASAHKADIAGNALGAKAEETLSLVGQSVRPSDTKLSDLIKATGLEATTQPAQPVAASQSSSEAAPELAGNALDVTATGTNEAQAETRPLTSQLSLANIRTTAEIAAQFVQKLGQRVARFDMVLTPETLGTVEVAMEVGSDGEVKARMVFDTPAAANELRARAEELRRQLNEAGFQVSENALEFTDRGQDQRGGFNPFLSDGRSGRRAFAGANRLADKADLPVAPVWTPVNLTPNGVDLKV